MSNINALSIAKITTTDAAPAAPATAAATVVRIAREATKDAGRVHVGGAMMRF